MIDINHPIRNEELQDINNPKNLDIHLAYLTENITEQKASEALVAIDFYKNWLPQHPEFKSGFPKEFQQLQQLIIDNEWIALRMLWPYERVLDIMPNQLMSLYTLNERYKFPYPHPNLASETLTEELRIFFTTINDFNDRDSIKQRIVQLMKESTAVVTSSTFYYKIKQVPAQLKMWIELYEDYMGENNESADRRVDFLKTSENGVLLTQPERDWLNIILTLYHRLQIPTISPFGLDEEIYYEDDNESGTFIYGEKKPNNPELVKAVNMDIAQNPSAAILRPPVEAVHPRSTPLGSVSTVSGPDIDATKGPDHFSEQDEREIELLTKSAGRTAAKRNEAYVTTAQGLVTSLGLSFASPDEEKRFSDLVVSVLRGLRDQMELKTYLIDLQFPSSEIEAILAAVKQELAGQPVTVQPVARKLAGKPTLAQLQKNQSGEVKSTTNMPAVESPAMEAAVEDQPRRSFLPKLRRSRAQKRQMVDDVKLQPTMVMSPIDELRAMDTVEFRRLSPDPYQAAARVKDKIELLGEESVTKQAEGVDAFKQSSLNKLYLELGNTSMSSNRPVTDLIAEREQKGTPTLSITEFAAIADLNKQIRF